VQDVTVPTPTPQEVRCAECGTVLFEGQDRQTTDGGTFCRSCFERLTSQVHQAIAAQGTDVNYSMALTGGLAGAVVGVAAWWGFTVLTEYALGLVAVVIGFTVGKGVTLLAGGKRHRNLQIMSVAIAGPSFFYASYLVNRTFVLKYYAAQGESVVLPLVPAPDLFLNLVMTNFGIMDLVFLAIVVYEAWRIPAPFKLAPAS
jgi:hypothetical protein